MTKEQEKAVDYVQKQEERYLYVPGIRTVYARLMCLEKEDIVRDDLSLRNEIQQHINEKEEKDKEIENYKKKNRDLSNQMLMLYKEQDNYNARIDKKNAEIEKKDKIIDLMAERIEWLCKSNGILLDKEHDENFTQEDIKKYFERKVRDERN